MSQHPLVICGDFNAPAIDWSTVSPTVSSHVANTMCDLVHDNFTHYVFAFFCTHYFFGYFCIVLTDVNVVDNLPSTDHDAIHPSLCLSVQPQKPCHRTLYDYKKVDLSELNAILSHVP